MPYVHIHTTAADVLNPAAQVGQYNTDRTNLHDNLDVQQLADQEDFRQQQLDLQAQDEAAKQALAAAALIDRRRNLEDQLAQQTKNQEAATDRTKLTVGGAMDRTKLVQGEMNQRAAGSAADRQALADHVSNLRMKEAQARQAGDLANADQLMKERQGFEQDLFNQRAKLQENAAAINRDFQARQQDQRLKSAAKNAANRYEFDRQKNLHEQKLKTINDQIQQLHGQLATAGSRRKDLEDQIDKLMQQYQQAAQEQEQWLSAPPPAAPIPRNGPAGQAATTQTVGPKKVSSAVDYDAVAPGEQFYDPDGVLRTKR